ncbi:uncharacterized protein N7484_007777 [Penicillium longicatenatum]|uniref:uncharacterized protein n=1 Tax=Penicillium longicatenatum TaxID=1561947 RepID=UPI00254689A6|nr:uncharacterized protein N7484_007777 [Penicillium longicatenatum]KAJ5639915.1 hypothetical protein N7484_007777 [Penicillium longicatenatum]
MASLLKAKSLLCIFGAVGITGTWVRTALDGSTEQLMKVMDDPQGRLPGSQALLQRTFTGIRDPMDHIISTLVVFWYEVVDGSHPASTAVALYFLGQLLPCILIAYTNGQRGSKPSLVSYITSSPTILRSSNAVPLEVLQRVSTLSSPALVKFLLLPAIVLGYLVPAGLMGIFSSSAGSMAHQTAIGAWNMYPLLILPILYVLRVVFSSYPVFSTGTSASASKKVHLHAVRAVNLPAIIFSFAMHFAVVAVSLVTILFPAIIKPAYLTELHPSAIFVPPLALPKATTPGDGVKGFLLWDQLIAYLVVMVVVTLELQSAWTSTQRAGSFCWSWYFPALFMTSLLLGPGTACLIVSWLRDEILFGGWIDEKEAKKAADKI